MKLCGEGQQFNKNMKKSIIITLIITFAPLWAFAITGSVTLDDITVQCGVPQYLNLTGNVTFENSTDILSLDQDDLGNTGEILNYTNTNGNKWIFDSSTGVWSNTGMRINSSGTHTVTARLYDTVNNVDITSDTKSFTIVACPLPAYRSFWEYTIDLTSDDVNYIGDELVIYSTNSTKKLQPGDTIELESGAKKHSIVLSDDNVLDLKTKEVKTKDTDDIFKNNSSSEKEIDVIASVNYLEKDWYYKHKNKLTQYLNREPTHNEILNSETSANLIEWVAEDVAYVTTTTSVQHQKGSARKIKIKGVEPEPIVEPVVETVKVTSSDGGSIPLPIIWGTAPCFGMWGESLDACVIQKYPNGELCNLVPVRTCVGLPFGSNCIPEPLKCEETESEKIESIISVLRGQLDEMVVILNSMLKTLLRGL